MTPRSRILISRSALLTNFKVISRQAPHLSFIAMLKADAYGHGALFCAEALKKEKRVWAFGVATFKEALELRINLKNLKVPIMIFSDSSPWSEDRARLCVQYHLEPVFSETMSVLQFQMSALSKKINAHLELNTGMNRLGLLPDFLPLVQFQPKSIFTHFADAEQPNSKITKIQSTCFAHLIPYLKSKFQGVQLHFANSAGIWKNKEYPFSKEMTLARPGLSLYGIRPYEQAKENGLKRVMTFKATVLNRIILSKGECVGYGATYIAKKDGEWAAIIGAGYADGVFRSQGNSGFAFAENQKCEFIGRVSMDLSAIRVSSKVAVGDEVELWGERVDPYEQSKAAGTIPYEITTRIGPRVERMYES